MIRAVLAYDEVRVPIVGPITVDVMNLGTGWQRFPEHGLSLDNVVPPSSETPVLNRHDCTHFVSSERISARILTPSRLAFAFTSAHSPAGMSSKRYRFPLSPCGLKSRE